MAEITQETVNALSAAGRGYDTAGDIAAYNTSDLRHEVSEVKATVKDAESQTRRDVLAAEGMVQRTIQTLQNFEAAQFAHVHEKACDAEKEAIKAQYEGKLQTIQTGKETDNRITDLERNVDGNFCKTNELVLKEAFATREAVFREGSLTREKVDDCCCELKERIAGLSRENVEQALAATKDELQEARFEAILAKVGK